MSDQEEEVSEYSDEEYEEEEAVVQPPPKKEEVPKEPEQEQVEEKQNVPAEDGEASSEEAPIEKTVRTPSLAQQALEAKEEQPKLRRAPPPQQKEAEPEEQTEAEKAMMAAKKRHEEEEAAKMVDYEERRRQEMDQMERELAELRERQTQRKEERKQEEAEMAARRREDEERRRKDEEERKAKHEEEKAKREEEKRKRQLVMAGAFVGGAGAQPGGRNFVIQKREGGGEAGQKIESVGGGGGVRRGPSREQQEEAKRNYMSIVNRPVDVSNMLPNDIKAKIKHLHSRIVKLESEKYDLEKLHERQQYDLKELGERQKQCVRHKALDSGMDPSELEDSGTHPPKVRVASKFDRQTDRRGYSERRDKFENPPAKPEPKLAHGSCRPPPEWGRKEYEELEQIRKNLEPPKYQEQVKVEGAKPPAPIIPLQLPMDDGTSGASNAVAAGGDESEKAGSGRKAQPPVPGEPGWREKISKKEEAAVKAPPKKVKV